jgi:hypothetical protein
MQGGTVSGPCSVATAVRLVNTLKLGPTWGEPTPVADMFCGPFTGAGSTAMAVMYSLGGTCMPSLGWGVFARDPSGTWQQVFKGDNLFALLAPAGSDIKETTPVFRAGDPRCLPSGGTHARIWQWNGKTFVAGPWKQVEPGKKPVKEQLHTGYLRTPSGNIQCNYGWGGSNPADDFLWCGVVSGLKPPVPKPAGGCPADSEYHGNLVFMRPVGKAAGQACSGDSPFSPTGQQLAYGKTWKGGGEFSCVSAAAGLSCRNASGHGFFLSRNTWHLF